MQLADIIPHDGKLQSNYCAACGTHLDLTFSEFDHMVSGINIFIGKLPSLICPNCGNSHLPDLSRYAIVQVHERAMEQGETRVRFQRRKRTNDWGRTAVKFIYDPDDYFYIPGLYRRFDEGFLQPVFFNRRALVKYDNLPGYRVRFASTTYGTIVTETDDLIAFGINRHGALVMWLGDIAKLPVNEQYYLRSENIPSDHAIGCEFYDGQIEIKATDRTAEDELFRLRSDFLEACRRQFGVSFAHLDEAVHALALEFNPPNVDTLKERRHMADTLNKIYLESLDNVALAEALMSAGVINRATGSLKRLQALLETVEPSSAVSLLMSPFYVLYDLRVVYSHLSTAGGGALPDSIFDRLDLLPTVDLAVLYERLIERLSSSYEGLILHLAR